MRNGNYTTKPSALINVVVATLLLNTRRGNYMNTTLSIGFLVVIIS